MTPTATRIFVCAEPVDMRRSFDGLARCTRELLSRKSGQVHARLRWSLRISHPRSPASSSTSQIRAKQPELARLRRKRCSSPVFDVALSSICLAAYSLVELRRQMQVSVTEQPLDSAASHLRSRVQGHARRRVRDGRSLYKRRVVAPLSTDAILNATAAASGRRLSLMCSKVESPAGRPQLARGFGARVGFAYQADTGPDLLEARRRQRAEARAKQLAVHRGNLGHIDHGRAR